MDKNFSHNNGTHHRIVVTGGPGGGKTTASDLFRRELGESVVIVPEAATMLFAGGFPRSHDPLAILKIQRAIYHVQENNEDTHCVLYPGRTLICDRGTIDGAAYWPGDPSQFFTELGTTLDDELRRYDAVIFFETAAVGGISIEGGNPVRTEDQQAAIDLDKRLHDLYSQHPNFTYVSHSPSFVKKVMQGLTALEGVASQLNK